MVAQCIKTLHPDHSNSLCRLSLVPALTDAVAARSTATLTFLRSHLPLQKHVAAAKRSTVPQASSGILKDGLISLLRASCGAGPVENRPRPLVACDDGQAVRVLGILSCDGLGLAADLGYDPYTGNVTGLVDVTNDDIMSLDPGSLPAVAEFAASRSAVSEAVVFMVALANGVVSTPVYVFYTDKRGGTDTARARYQEVIRSLGVCLSCLESAEEAHHQCDATDIAACTACKAQNKTCVRLRVLAFSTDRASGELGKHAHDDDSCTSVLLFG